MELPVFRRCCFCFPLRYGLITWGYLRLASSMLFFIGMSISAYGVWQTITTEKEPNINIGYAIVLGLLLLMSVTDLILNTLFIVGGHKKNLKLLRVYYIYSFIICVLTSLLGITSVVYTLFLFRIGEVDLSFHLWFILVDTTTLLAQILAQVYVVLLVRSEIIKLRSNCEFRFVNNAAEAECTLKCADVNGGGESEYQYERYAPELYNK